MAITIQLAKHLRDVCFGGNWTSVNLKDVLKDLTLQEARFKVSTGNNIVTLLYHLHYYTTIQLRFLKGEGLHGKDAESFIHPEVNTHQELSTLIRDFLSKLELLASGIEALDDSVLEQPFADEKFGTYYRNMAGMIEHLHYHMGQMVILRKLAAQEV